jgi:hypothetical protein
MYKNSELLEVLDEGELVYVSAEFWFKYHDRLDPGKSTLPEAYDALLAFQNGWIACKEFYKIDT